MRRPVTEISETFGLWERSLIAWPDGRQDTTTFAAWLQGPTLFADLRQPDDPPSFAGVSCLEHLGPEHFDWLARQEGFAGRFVRAGGAYEWQRMIDFQCPTSASDAGYLEFDNGVLVEEGRDIPYIEHWHHTSRDLTPLFALRMQDANACTGFLVRVGELFMFVRPRAEPLPHGASLPDLVANTTPDVARTLLDCEISLGRVTGDVWSIERSSLPYRVGADLAPTVTSAHPIFTTQDITRDGKPFTRAWTVVEFDPASQRETDKEQGNDHGLSSFQPATGRAS
ncbi:hypothetical protein [Hyphomicrobium sp. CS1GBMeth3]|uniref:hypothetical protein n=1 Tax=Hyphomicrobium sp. CS1GBMeth3 TaxID=1892845 RepID=UPI0009305720|nr:hypothetical protein [Hyphomicrobium sp. CS1GBMeth3]